MDDAARAPGGLDTTDMIPPEDYEWFTERFGTEPIRMVSTENPGYSAYREKYRKLSSQHPLPVVHNWGTTRRQAVKALEKIKR